MMISCLPRVLLVDNDPVKPELIKSILLNSEHYNVELVVGHGTELFSKVMRTAHGYRPHVAVLDLRMSSAKGLDELNPGDVLGLDILKELASQCQCILYSSFLNSKVDLQVKKLGGSSWVHKADSPDVLLSAIEEAVRAGCACRRGCQIQWSSQWDTVRIVHTLFGENTDVPPAIVDDVLGRLFPDAAEVILQTLTGKVTTPKSVERGRSVILKAWVNNKRQPVIVKLAQSDRIRQEIIHHHEVDGNLRGHFQASVFGDPVCFWDLGAICYHYLSDQHETYLFTDFYHDHQQVQVILKPLRHFFTDVWEDLYKDASESKKPLFDAYIEKLEKLEERLRSFPNQDKRITFHEIPVPLLNPVAWALRHRADSDIAHTRLAITHGDLHGDNLLVTRNFAWPIDYERSGRGPIVRDFVELEVDIVTRLMEGSNRSVFLAAIALAQTQDFKPPSNLKIQSEEEPRIVKALGVISGLRTIMSKETSVRDFREYLWGLLLDADFVATHLPESNKQRESALIFGAVVCERLANPGHSWPPTEWVQTTPSTPDPVVPSPRRSSSAMVPGIPYNAFLSYSRRDEHAVIALVDRLITHAELRVWLDQTSLLPGDPWQQKMEQALEDCDSCIVCWGSEGLGAWQHEELRSALEHRVKEQSYRVIPVLLPNCRAVGEIPAFLRNLTWADLRSGIDNGREFNRLVEAIKTATADRKNHGK